MTGHLLETVVLPVRGRTVVPYVDWLREWPSAVSDGAGGVTITLAAGSVPDPMIAWLVNDPALWSDGRVPVAPAGSRPAPLAFSQRRVTQRWWDAGAGADIAAVSGSTRARTAFNYPPV